MFQKMFSTHKTKTVSKTYSKVATFMTFLVLSLPGFVTSDTDDIYVLPGLHEKTYIQMGDINIGAMSTFIDNSPTNPIEACSDDITLPDYAVQTTEAVVFAVDLVNSSPHILPNVSLGYHIRAVCHSVGVTIGTSLSFLPRVQYMCSNSTCSSVTAGSNTSGASAGSNTSGASEGFIGVLGAGWSSLTVPVSSLYAVGNVPLMGAIETSDELSNKRNHPYFFRLVPPDMYQVQAMLRFIYLNKWSYISVIYEHGSYGQRAFDGIKKNADRFGICVATNHRLMPPPNYNAIVSDLLLNHRARVVVLFIYESSFREILQAMVDNNAQGHFIWIGSDSLTSYSGYHYRGVDTDPGIGTFIFDLHTLSAPAFSQYLRRQKVSTSKNPWMKQAWEYLFDCSHDEGTCDSSDIITKSSKFTTFAETSVRINSVLILAQAAHNLVSTKCPGVQGKVARDCITGEMLREFLKNTTFDGIHGHVKFDDNQDVKGKYILSQLGHKTSDKDTNIIAKTTIGFYDVLNDDFIYFKENVSWHHISTRDHFINISQDMYFNEAPTSVCSIPCVVGEYKIEKKLPCCWECRKCRENEHLVKDNTTCETCPSFMWPDPASGFTSCVDIPLTYPMFNDPIPIVFISLAFLALMVTVFVIVSYTIYRNERVIKASSTELSVIQLFAILTGYTTIMLFQTKPTDVMCGLTFFMFCMSFVLLYSPLLVKTVRICRIFKSGSKNQQPRFISSGSQLVFACSLISVQVILCIAVYILYWPRAKLTQPIWSEKLVELSCDLTFPGIASFLGYNIVLVFMCSVFAFMVRKLPDNFNESKFISMCVSTTLLLWLVFTPAYFTASRAFVRVFLLSAALTLNNSVALALLFIPKIYAARFIPSEAGNFSKNRS